MSYKGSVRLVIFFLLSLLLTESGIAATIYTRSLTSRRSKQTVSESQRAKKRINRLARSRASRSRKARILRAGHRRRRYYERFTASSFRHDAIEGDVTAGENPVVRP